MTRLREEAEQLAAALPPLLADAGRLASSISLGIHGRRKAGSGESFWQFRRYAAEDPAAAIDWRQSAKSQHLFVREREWEVAQAVWFWRDGSATMRFASQTANVSKIDRATVLLLALASLLSRGGERIGLLGGKYAPAYGRVGLQRLAHELAEARRPDDPLPPDGQSGRGAQLVWLSDFLSPPQDVRNVVLRLAAAGFTGHLVHIIDPAEEDFPFEGRVRFEALGRAESEIFGRAESVKALYTQRFRAHAEQVSSLARQFGWSYVAHRTDSSAASALATLYSAVGGDAVRRTA
ncbi:MAG: DUF58 domain-containing protein [Alphaproteobacteria bacterium]